MLNSEFRRLHSAFCILNSELLLFLIPRLRRRHGLRRLLRHVLPRCPPGQDDVHLVAFLPRHRLGHGLVAEVRDQSLQDAAPDFRVRHLAAAEEDRRLHLVAVREEAFDVLPLEVVIMLVDLGAELDLLHLDHALVLLRLAGSFLLLVLVFAEVHDSAHRRHGSRRDLDQVEPLLTRDGDRLRRRHDPELLAGFVDHANFTNPDALVGADTVVTSGRTIESYSCLLCGCCSLVVRSWWFRSNYDTPFLAISSCASAMKALTPRAPRSPPVRLRTETVPSAASRSPATSM